MRKIITLISLALTLSAISCLQPQKRETTKMVDKRLPLENIVDDVMTTHPNYFNNEVTRNDANKDFEKSFFAMDTNQLEGIPFTLVVVNKANGKNMAQFRSFGAPDNFKFVNSIEKLNCDVLAVIPDSIVSCLKEKEDYILYGSIVNRIKNIELFEKMLGTSTMAATYDFEIRKVDNYDDTFSLEVCLGMFYFKLDSIKPYIKREQIEEE